MNIIDITDKLPTEGSNGRRMLAAVSHLVVHHDAAPVGEDYDPIKRYEGQAKFHISKGWKRLAYHLRIDTEGNVYQANEFQEITWHAGNYRMNLKSISVCLDGDLTKTPPTAKQVAALWELMQYLISKRPDMPKLLRHTITTHREVRLMPTTCPSDCVYSLVQAFRSY